MLSPCAPEGLFVDRVAFTAEHLFQKLQSQPPSMYNVQLVAYSIYLIIEAASTMAGNMHQVQIFDWHAENVAFTKKQKQTQQNKKDSPYSDRPYSDSPYSDSPIMPSLGGPLAPPPGPLKDLVSVD